MIKRVLFAAVLTAVVLQFAPAHAAGPYDGSWSGDLVGAGSRCMGGTVSMQIANSAITGVVGLPGGTIRIRGNVAPDGSVNAKYSNPSTGGESTLTGKISGGDFKGELETKFPAYNITCDRDVTAKHS